MNTQLQILKTEVKEVLLRNIMPFWSEKMIDQKNGGFYGRITGNDRIIPEADKGGILNARILWTFSSVYLQEKNPPFF